ncbi:acyl-CoA dehydrogenase family protein [Pseudomonas sp. BF-R-19]|uniref:acyl-CoA dehydrogenase family protein n=1 Tax=Pseudomonas sp. BF-R-19 TaxID=2832397 RepID=UPI001CBE6BF2|nr:acyl-CoA dehydrogenase family protein [Pseudomonas sp. BF-R-19]
MHEHLTPYDFNALSDDEFRLRFRAWLKEYYPEQWRQNDRRPYLRLVGEDLRACMLLLNEHGWRAPAWPREYGGMGLSFRKQWIYQQEWERAAGARIVEPGETHLGPTLFQYGTEEQKAAHLPRILRCDDLWVQGYSEPNAGSDLASLRTRAIREGDDFIVNGQKIWTTQASTSTHIFALVRTGQYEKKQQGITFLLIDLRAPGVSVRPIMNLAGDDELCEVFFDDVRVPVSDAVGAVDDGWQVAKSLLGHERLWLGSPAMANSAMHIATRLVKEIGLETDVGVTDRLAQLQCDLHDYRLLYTDICEDVANGAEVGPGASVLKVYISELLQRIVQFNAGIAAEYGAVIGDVQVGDLSTNLHWPFMWALPTTIYAGCNEVQRDILAKTVLKLPA